MDKIVSRIRPLAAGTPLHAPHLTHDLNSSPHRAWEEPSRLRRRDASPCCSAAASRRPSTRRTGGTATSQRPAHAQSSSRSLRSTTELRAASCLRRFVWVRPDAPTPTCDRASITTIPTIQDDFSVYNWFNAHFKCNKHPIYAAVPYTKHQSEAVLLAPSTLPTGDAMDYVSDNFGAAAATAPLHNFRVWRGAHGWAHAACRHVS